MVVTLGQQYNVGEKPTVILYTYINRHAGTPNITKINKNIVVHTKIETNQKPFLPSLKRNHEDKHTCLVNHLELSVYYCRRIPISGWWGREVGLIKPSHQAFPISRMNFRPVYLQLVPTCSQGFKHPDVCEANQEDFFLERCRREVRT